MKALVVESSIAMMSVLRRILSMRGFEVVEANSCGHAIDVIICMGTADLVLVEWVPHEISSLEFITRLRHEATGRPLVILLAPVEPGMQQLHRALTAGADDYLIRPFTSLQMDEKLAHAGFVWRMRDLLACRSLTGNL